MGPEVTDEEDISMMIEKKDRRARLGKCSGCLTRPSFDFPFLHGKSFDCGCVGAAQSGGVANGVFPMGSSPFILVSNFSHSVC